MYDIKDLKEFIKYYNCLNISSELDNIEIDNNINDFFDIENYESTFEINDHTDDIAFMNDLLKIAEAVGTDKEFILFYLMSTGNTLGQTSKIFNLSNERIRQIYNKILMKICNELNHNIIGRNTF